MSNDGADYAHKIVTSAPTTVERQQVWEIKHD